MIFSLCLTVVTMTQTETQSYQDDLAALLGVLSGATKDDPINACQTFMHAHPQRSEGYFILGVLTYLSGYVGSAIEMVEKAHDIDPDVREYALALASLYSISGRLNDALYFAKVGAVMESDPQMAGILPPGLQNFVQAAGGKELHRHYIDASMAFNRREFALAIAECELELKMDPSYVPALELYGRTLIEVGEHGRAISCFQAVQQHDPDCSADVQLSLADSFCHLGLFEDAKPYIEAALHKDPASVDIGVRAYGMLASMPDSRQACGKVLATLQQNALRLEQPYFDYAPPQDRKIRIGFLSDKFYNCFEGIALNALVQRMDRNVFEPYAYIQNINKDHMTQTVINTADSSREVFDINDKTLSLIMQRDEIDILVDMCGFGPGQRLSFLAHQPCGVRVSWLAPPHDGAQPGVKYVVTDDSTHDVQSRLLQQDQNQECIRLKSPLFTLPPVKGYGPPAPLPASQKGHVTFGAQMDFRALSSGLAGLWGRLLDSVEGSVLRMNVGDGISNEGVNRLSEIFEPLGLLDRIQLYTPDEDERMGGFFDQVDVYLASSFDTPKGVLEALWMGAPCITKVDDSQSMRNTASTVLTGAGAPSWVCRNDDELCAVAKDIVSDLSALAIRRTGLREQVEQSALMNLDGFALEFQGQLANVLLRHISAEGDL